MEKAQHAEWVELFKIHVINHIIPPKTNEVETPNTDEVKELCYGALEQWKLRTR